MYRVDYIPAAHRVALLCRIHRVARGQHYIVIRTKVSTHTHTKQRADEARTHPTQLSHFLVLFSFSFLCMSLFLQTGSDVYCLLAWSIRYSDLGDLQAVVYTLAPLPRGTPVPPFVDGNYITENHLVFGPQLNNAHRQNPDAWRVALMHVM